MANDPKSVEAQTRSNADSAIANRFSVLESRLNGTYAQTLGDPIPDPSFGKALVKAAKHVICVAWTVPAVRSQLVTLLVRFGLPGSLVAIGMAVGEKLAQ